MPQFRMQTDQMTSQFNHLSVQLASAASTPRPLTPSHLQPPPGTVPQVDTETVSDDSVHKPDNTTWLHGPPLVTDGAHPPIIGARSIRYTSVAAVTPQTASSAPPSSSAPTPTPTLPFPSRLPSCTLFSLGGSQSGHHGQGNGAPYGPQRTQEYLSGYYWDFGMPTTSPVSVPWLELSLHSPYNGKSEKLQKAPLTLADDSLTGFIQFYNVL